MSANSFLVVGMAFSYLVKELETSAYPGINRIYAEDNLSVGKEIRFFFGICSPISDDANFLRMIKINAMKEIVVGGLEIKVADLIGSLFWLVICVSGYLCTKLVLERKDNVFTDLTIFDEGGEGIFGRRREFSQVFFYGFKLFIFGKSIRKEIFAFLYSLVWEINESFLNLHVP